MNANTKEEFQKQVKKLKRSLKVKDDAPGSLINASRVRILPAKEKTNVRSK